MQVEKRFKLNFRTLRFFLTFRHLFRLDKYDSKKKNSIIFISHDLTRTGAPKVLLTFLKWLTHNTNLDFAVVSPYGGALEEEFKSVTQTFILRENISEFLKYLKNHNICLIYSNTVVNGRLQKLFSTLKAPQICHIHEMPEAIKGFGKKNLRRVQKHTDSFIAVSDVVKDGLINDFGISEDKITKINAFIDLHQINDSKEELQKLKSELGISQNTFILGSVGGLLTHKGADLAIKLAKNLTSKIQDFKYIWLGVNNKEEEKQNLELITDYNLENIFVPVKPTNNPFLYYELFDVFVMCSRMDSFPLVNLEAGMIKKPIVCFEKSGGTVEFVSDANCGFICPESDVECMANKIMELKNNTALSDEFGKNAHKKVTGELSTINQAPKIYELIKKYL